MEDDPSMEETYAQLLLNPVRDPTASEKGRCLKRGEGIYDRDGFNHKA